MESAGVFGEGAPAREVLLMVVSVNIGVDRTVDAEAGRSLRDGKGRGHLDPGGRSTGTSRTFKRQRW